MMLAMITPIGNALNYLGLANDPRLMEAAREAIARYGLGMVSVRFISGTNELHWTLESGHLAQGIGYANKTAYQDQNGRQSSRSAMGAVLRIPMG
jgi:hypothetical protein